MSPAAATGGRLYAAVDLKSFFASVEAVARQLDPFDACLVVADPSRTAKTICLAVTPALKALGVPGRPRLFEARARVKAVNQARAERCPDGGLRGSSYSLRELRANPSLQADFIIAPPRMHAYLTRSAAIYRIYLRYFSPAEILVYSVDEVFLDLTAYLQLYRLGAAELIRKILREITAATGITATAGIGTNLFLAKVAMDILAKRSPPDENGARMAQLDEISFRRHFWTYQPLTDFWRIGPGLTRRLAELRLYNLGDIARCSVGGRGDYYNEELLFRKFGINAELLIDHAWGYEPVSMAEIKAQKVPRRSLGSGQVLTRPYPVTEARTVLSEMAGQLALKLYTQALCCRKLVLDIGYDAENLRRRPEETRSLGLVADHYGRPVPRPAHGTQRLPQATCAQPQLIAAARALFERLVKPALTVRHLNLAALDLSEFGREITASAADAGDLFAPAAPAAPQGTGDAAAARTLRLQHTLLSIKAKFGRNAILTGLNFAPGATGRERNRQIGGHRA